VKIIAYLNFDGRCAEAFRVYERVLGGTIEMTMIHGESPQGDSVPAVINYEGDAVPA
jgi:PhnB protein